VYSPLAHKRARGVDASQSRMPYSLEAEQKVPGTSETHSSQAPSRSRHPEQPRRLWIVTVPICRVSPRSISSHGEYELLFEWHILCIGHSPSMHFSAS